jgi:hypothetical protein
LFPGKEWDVANDFFELTDVLKAEYKYIHGTFPERALTLWFKRDHIVDPGKLALRLKTAGTGDDPLSTRLYDLLRPEAKKQLDRYRKDGSPPESLQNCFVEVLNGLLIDPDLPGAAGLSAEVLAEGKARARIDTTVPGKGAQETMSLNRRLLEMVYSDEIKKTQDTLSGIYEHIHEKGHAALCLSGGGIRSATFCLGVIQALAEHTFLDKFQYLSTVSGGGYIGSWLSAWSHRHPDGLDGVMKELSIGPVSSTEPEPAPVTRLRALSNYLTPKIGAFSADTWTLAATYLRNLFLNWLVLVPLLAAVVVIPKLQVGLMPSMSCPLPERFGYLVLLAGFVFLVISLWYIGLNRPSSGNRQSGQGAFLVYCLAPLLVSTGCITIYYASLDNGPTALGPKYWPLIIIGAGLNLIAWLLQLWARRPRTDKGVRETPIPDNANLVWELIAILGTGALGGLLVWLTATHFPTGWIRNPELYVCVSVPLLLGLLLVTETVFVGLVSASTTDEDREWWARSAGWVLIAATVWGGGCALVIYGPRLLSIHGPGVRELVVAIGSLSGISTILTGKSSKTPAKEESKSSQSDRGSSLQPLLAKWSVALLTPVFAAFLVIVISFGVDWLARLDAWPSPLRTSNEEYPWIILLILLGGFVCLSLFMGWFINVNKFSLNAMYRNRLIRAYLGASRNYRNPNAFTGFDPEDNLQMHELGKHNSLGFEKKNLFHVLNLTLNLVAGDNPAWQERKAESFTVSPLHCGNHALGYRSSEEYGGKRNLGAGKPDSGSSEKKSDSSVPPEPATGISLGTAVSISGAAASPNMGYNSSAALTFLMTLFNARLGAWLGNPGRFGDRSYGRPYPRFGYLWLVRELFGMTNDTSHYVYLSDGGHFENLGLYEMVLRRCLHIVVIDAGHDNKCTFGDLGNAVRKIRADMGVRIDFNEVDIYPRSTDKDQNKKGTYCAIGTIRYSDADNDGQGPGDRNNDGKLLYIKPAFYGLSEPRDIYEYAMRSPEFPHESTADQWFSESQFESYRALGRHVFNRIYPDGGTGSSLADLFEAVKNSLDAQS